MKAIENYTPPRFCNDEKDLYKVAQNNPFRKMVGTANPKTFRTPIVENRPMDLDAWRDDDRIRDSRTNNPSAPDLYLSGYTTFRGYPNDCSKQQRDLYPRYDQIKEHFMETTYQAPIGFQLPPKGMKQPEYVVQPDLGPSPPSMPSEKGGVAMLSPCQAQTINANLPSNIDFGSCPQDPRMKAYNQQLFTQKIGVDAYTQSEVIEPINSNYGITATVPLRPTIAVDEPGGHTKYLELDPDIPREVVLGTVENFEEPRYDNVYDPRGSGYGTSYRSYIEPVTGQPRFFYDDVNALRMPNYITRSKIDFLPYADTYGQQREAPEQMNGMVQHDWLKNTNDFREDMMRSLMRKRNNEMWQLRVAPLGPKRG